MTLFRSKEIILFFSIRSNVQERWIKDSKEFKDRDDFITQVIKKIMSKTSIIYPM